RMRLLTEFPQGAYTEDTYAFLGRTPCAPTGSPCLDTLSFDDSLRIANQLAARDRYDQALDLYKRIAQRFPNAANQAAYRGARIRALFHSRHYSELLAEPAVNDPALQLLRARAAWRAGQNDVFLAGLARILDDADSKTASEA